MTSPWFGSSVPKPLTTIQKWQVGLIAFGVGLLLAGGVVLLMDVKPERYLGIAVWFIGALIVHDGIAAMAVFGVSIFMRRAGKRIPVVVIAIVQGALVIGAIFTAIVVPEILKKSIGSANPTILPLNYGLNLLLFYAGLAVVTAGAIVVALVVRRRSRVE